MDLGDDASAPQLQLLLTAWIDYADSTANFKASQTGAKLVPPYLQARSKQGQWETVIPRMGFGDSPTMVVDEPASCSQPRGAHRYQHAGSLGPDPVNTSGAATAIPVFTNEDLRYAGFLVSTVPTESVL